MALVKRAAKQQNEEVLEIASRHSNTKWPIGQTIYRIGSQQRSSLLILADELREWVAPIVQATLLRSIVISCAIIFNQEELFLSIHILFLCVRLKSDFHSQL